MSIRKVIAKALDGKSLQSYLGRHYESKVPVASSCCRLTMTFPREAPADQILLFSPSRSSTTCQATFRSHDNEFLANLSAIRFPNMLQSLFLYKTAVQAEWTSYKLRIRYSSSPILTNFLLQSLDNFLALLEQLAPRPNRPGPRSSQASHSPVESRNSSPTQPSTASATDSTAQSDPLSGSYSPIFTSSPRSAGPPPQNPPSNTASSNSATKAPSSDMQLAHHIAQSYSVHQRAEKSFALGQSAEKLQDKTTQDELAQQSHRRWRRGDVYAPRDLGVVEMKKWRVKSVTPKRDVFDELGIDPRKEYKVMMGFPPYFCSQWDVGMSLKLRLTWEYGRILRCWGSL